MLKVTLEVKFYATCPRSEGHWLEAQSLSLCCFLRQETLPYIVCLQPGVYQRHTAGVTLRWTSIPSRGE